MPGLEIIKSASLWAHTSRGVRTTTVLVASLLAAASAKATVFYSSAAPTVATSSICGTPLSCGGVELGTSAQLANLTLAANVYASQSPVRVRLPLTGTAPAGHRAGMLVSSLGSLANLDLLSTVTLRTYLNGVLQESQPVDITLLKAMLLAGNGSPEQLEFTSKFPFDNVELELGSVTSMVGEGLQVQYAYGVEANTARQVAGYVSRFTDTTNKYDVGGCTSGINNPERAVTSSLTDYATFSSLASINCPKKLQVKLEAPAPSGYRAGFVLGGLDNILSTDLLGGIVLKTYKDGVLKETSSNLSLLNLSVLPTGQTFVSFPTTTGFDAVSIERVGTLSVLDNLQIYYGTGMSPTSPTQVRSDWGTTANHYQKFVGGGCLLCSVSNPDNAVDGNLNNYATLNVTAGVANSVGMKLDLNGGGKAGNRAGMVLGHQGGLLDANALSRITLSTYDATGKVLETKSGSSLLNLALLPDGRQNVSFNTTRDFASVGITVNGVAGVVDNTNIYYAYADDSNGQVSIVTPTGPLPVSLTSFAVRRVASSGVATLSWTTASEVNSASFVVERTSNPATGFVAIGQVAAAGNSVMARSYKLVDNEAGTQTGTLYYRLRQLDVDGQAHLSAVVALVGGPITAGVSLYPNPATAASQRVTLSTSLDLRAGYSVQLYSAMGQLLSSREVSSEAATSAPTVSTTGLAAGVYHVVLRDASGQQVAAQRLQIAN
jgi:hypothetical protein